MKSDYPNTRAALKAYYEGAWASWNKSADELNYDVRLAFYEDTWQTRTKDECLSMTVSQIVDIVRAARPTPAK